VGEREPSAGQDLNEAQVADETSYIYLIPGFFGFSQLGTLHYFDHVCRFLERGLHNAGISFELVPVRTFPTSSVAHRSARLLEVIAESYRGTGPIHLIAHSTGGLDARLFLTPGAKLPTSISPEPYAQRVQSLTTIACPHYGTPLAAFFHGLFGHRLLELLSLSTFLALRFGRVPIRVMLGMARWMRQPKLSDDEKGVAVLEKDLVMTSNPGQQYVVEQFLADMSSDQSLIGQLNPENMDLFNASTGDRSGIRYASVMAIGRTPGLRSTLSEGADLYAQASHALYRALYRIAGRMPSARRNVKLSDNAHRQIREQLGWIPDWSVTDGIVPSRSQVWGELLHIATADHLDVIGHFGDNTTQPPHFDWMASGNRFGRPEFESLWRSVLDPLLIQLGASVPSAPPLTPPSDVRPEVAVERVPRRSIQSHRRLWIVSGRLSLLGGVIFLEFLRSKGLLTFSGSMVFAAFFLVGMLRFPRFVVRRALVASCPDGCGGRAEMEATHRFFYVCRRCGVLFRA
jgi:triacylglycerol lipase